MKEVSCGVGFKLDGRYVTWQTAHHFFAYGRDIIKSRDNEKLFGKSLSLAMVCTTVRE